MTTKSLSYLAAGQKGVIHRIDGDGFFSQRLLEMGLTPGTRIEVVRFAPLGDPLEIVVRGYRLSLRKQEAEAIEVLVEESRAE